MPANSEPVAPALGAVSSLPARIAADYLLGRPVSSAWTARFTLAWLGFWIANLVPLQLRTSPPSSPTASLTVNAA